MYTIIAIDTSTEVASATLLYNGRMITRESIGFQNHSRTILPMVQDLLAVAGISLGQCDALAFGIGPGSFTGVRITCGVVQGLAFGADLPVVPIVTLSAMAQACRDLRGANEVLAILDARIGEVYWAQYRFVENMWEIVVEPTLSKPSQVSPLPSVGNLHACGNGLSAYADDFLELVSGSSINLLPEIMPNSRQIAHLGNITLGLEGGKSVSSETQPLYLRRKVALTNAERIAALSYEN
jgi:tRNA threonylcarbamoyladenosine biosynthesis protein TsaB